MEEFRRRGLDPDTLGLTRDHLRQRILQARQRAQVQPQEIPVTPQRRRQQARRRLNERSRSLASRIIQALGSSIQGREIATAHPELRSVNNFAAVIQLVNRMVNEELEMDAGERGEIPFERLEDVLARIDEIGDRAQDTIRQRLSRR